MSESVRTLLTESIDYAGLFPPAHLSLNESLENYASYLEEPAAWLIARFACPTTHLTELSYKAHVFQNSKRAQHRVTVVVSAHETAKQFCDELRYDLANAAEFEKRHGGHATIDAIELKLPGDLAGSDSRPIAEFLTQVRQMIETAGFEPLLIVEPGAGRMAADIQKVLESLKSTGEGRLCAKLRTGGLPRGDLPSPEQFAGFIDGCRNSGTRWKATAGLHHPLSNFDQEDDVWHFGFLNVFAAAVLAVQQPIGVQQIEEVLTESSLDSFAFSDELFSWKDFRLAIPEIVEGRARSILSFGTCSFEQPRDELRASNLIA